MPYFFPLMAIVQSTAFSRASRARMRESFPGLIPTRIIESTRDCADLSDRFGAAIFESTFHLIDLGDRGRTITGVVTSVSADVCCGKPAWRSRGAIATADRADDLGIAVPDWELKRTYAMCDIVASNGRIGWLATGRTSKRTRTKNITSITSIITADRIAKATDRVLAKVLRDSALCRDIHLLSPEGRGRFTKRIRSPLDNLKPGLSTFSIHCV
jgi:hypothetical protein